MKRIACLLLAVGCCAILGTARISSGEEKPAGYRRVVSLLPSITEILFALDQQDKIVGVTRYCKHPPQAQQKPKVGGILDISFETLYHLNPDLVMMEESALDQKEQLEKMGFKALALDTRSVEGILGSIATIGAILECEENAAAITTKINNKIELIRSKVKELPKPKVLITYLRPVGEGSIRDVYIAGNHTYFNDFLEVVGAVNAYQGTDLITSPVVSAEGILRMDPDVIIEVINMLDEAKVTKESMIKDWDMLPELKAYKNKRIYIFDQPYIGIPGPRIDLALEDFARVIHPQLNWDQ